MMALSIATKFYPIRLLAHIRNETEMNMTIDNRGNEPYWVEVEVAIPNGMLSLAPDKALQNGRLRAGILFPNETKNVKCKIYAGGLTYPDEYPLKITALAFNREGVISSREDAKALLRCERISVRKGGQGSEGIDI